jgi:hypothetical protein
MSGLQADILTRKLRDTMQECFGPYRDFGLAAGRKTAFITAMP